MAPTFYSVGAVFQGGLWLKAEAKIESRQNSALLRLYTFGPRGCWDFPLIAKIESDVRFGFRSRNFYGHFRARAVFAEERIHRLEQDGFPAAHHLRKLGIKPGVAQKIKLISVEAIVSCEVDPRPRHRKE